MEGIELFAGGGGLLLGSALAGVRHHLAAEWNKWACKTIRENSLAGHHLVSGIKVLERDIRGIDWSTELLDSNSIDIVSGGPPCQPFSLGGLARYADDPRDMFPAMTHAIKQILPKAFLVENVKGLTRSSFSSYFDYIKLRLTYPEIESKQDEKWDEHYLRLKKENIFVRDTLTYNLHTVVVNAADYGIPQHRHRVIIVGIRDDIGAEWKVPQRTHSGNALAKLQEDGSYWDKHEVPSKQRVSIKQKAINDGLLPWVTVRDALSGLPEPSLNTLNIWRDHIFQPGAKIYPGHTGSPLDEPSKALKAGVHGVPGGENMIRFPDGTVRYYTIREAARIQTFPDDYALHGAWSEAMRQLGNAVPVQLAEIFMSSVVNSIKSVSHAKNTVCAA